MTPTAVLQSTDITNVVIRAATDAGFELAGVAPVEDSSELEYFPLWIAEGHAGEMKYLEARDERGRLKRASLANSAPWARSVVVCAINYNTAEPYSTDARNHSAENRQRGWISRYAWGEHDYHDSVMPRLLRVESALRSAVASDDLVTRCYVDTGPIVERVAAKYAGIGWIGKNTCIINQKLGSWLFLGVILTSLDLTPGLPAPDRCGSCTRCIDACPTDAFIAPYQLDSNKCIAYLTIEKRGAIPPDKDEDDKDKKDEDLRSAMGRHVFGCDICLDVCPWNRKTPATGAADFQPREELVNPALEWLADISADEFRRTFKTSPLRRAKRAGLRRNAVIAMGNSRDRNFLPQLEKLTTDDDEVVAQSALWAIQKLNSPD